MNIRAGLIVFVVVAVSGYGAVVAFSQKPAQLSDFMQLKLTHAQKILAGVALEDFEAIAKNARDLRLQSMEESWKVFVTPEYVQHSDEFRRAAKALEDAAEDKNLDGTALEYVGMTLKCVSCHKYVRDVQMAGRSLDTLPTNSGE